MGTLRRCTGEEVSELIDSSDWSIIPGFRPCGYIILFPDCFMANGKIIRHRLPVMDNAPYKIGGKLWALWDMRKNSPEWDSVDVFCGIVHEMMHCFQIERGIHETGAFFTEGAALYAELLFKSRVRGRSLFPLLEEYGIFAREKGNERLMPYYLGASMIFLRVRMGVFSWDKYFMTGKF